MSLMTSLNSLTTCRKGLVTKKLMILINLQEGFVIEEPGVNLKGVQQRILVLPLAVGSAAHISAQIQVGVISFEIQVCND